MVESWHHFDVSKNNIDFQRSNGLLLDILNLFFSHLLIYFFLDNKSTSTFQGYNGHSIFWGKNVAGGHDTVFMWVFNRYSREEWVKFNCSFSALVIAVLTFCWFIYISAVRQLTPARARKRLSFFNGRESAFLMIFWFLAEFYHLDLPRLQFFRRAASKNGGFGGKGERRFIFEDFPFVLTSRNYSELNYPL